MHCGTCADINPQTENSLGFVLRWSGKSFSSAQCLKPSVGPPWTLAGWQETAGGEQDCRSATVDTSYCAFGWSTCVWIYLVDISKRSLTELTLQPVAPHLSSSCSQSVGVSNQFMWESRRRLLRNCFISEAGECIFVDAKVWHALHLRGQSIHTSEVLNVMFQ